LPLPSAERQPKRSSLSYGAEPRRIRILGEPDALDGWVKRNVARERFARIAASLRARSVPALGRAGYRRLLHPRKFSSGRIYAVREEGGRPSSRRRAPAMRELEQPRSAIIGASQCSFGTRQRRRAGSSGIAVGVSALGCRRADRDALPTPRYEHKFGVQFEVQCETNQGGPDGC
jgi:hypothetical protein